MSDRTSEKKVRYEVKSGERWIRCKRASPQKANWLHFELRDGTVGLARPGNWRTT